MKREKFRLSRALGIPLATSLAAIAIGNYSPSQVQSAPKSQSTQITSTESRPEEYSLSDYVDAVIEIASHGNPLAERFEAHINDHSYGLGQILTSTAKDLEERHPELPRLGNTKREIKESLFNPEINRAYTRTLFKEELDFYGDPLLAVAAYNSGHLTPRNARSQEQLNDLYKTNLSIDGIIGNKSKPIVKGFQSENNLYTDGKVGTNTSDKLNNVWESKFPGRENPRGAIPQNRYTPNHVRKFKEALEN
ncbi:MAG: peptidoglycan-binding protein [Nanoarchaeota archaeon]|nr:peptidoglycan-binding protein [Nanoarchaeota archaeon]